MQKAVQVPSKKRKQKSLKETSLTQVMATADRRKPPGEAWSCDSCAHTNKSCWTYCGVCGGVRRNPPNILPVEEKGNKIITREEERHKELLTTILEIQNQANKKATVVADMRTNQEGMQAQIAMLSTIMVDTQNQVNKIYIKIEELEMEKEREQQG